MSDSDSDTWVEVTINGDGGIGVTQYKEETVGEAEVVEEMWFTDAELEDESNAGSYVFDGE